MNNFEYSEALRNSPVMAKKSEFTTHASVVAGTPAIAGQSFIMAVPASQVPQISAVANG